MITHAYEGFVGEMTLLSGLRVIYLPLIAFYNQVRCARCCRHSILPRCLTLGLSQIQCTFPTVFFSLPRLRKIFLENRIDVVHCHSAFSSLCHEALLAGKVLGLKVAKAYIWEQ